MDFAKFQRLVEERPGFRTMENPTASGEYFSDSCGDMYNVFLRIGPGEVIEDITYFTTGCGFGTATCSLVAEMARGKNVTQAEAITEQEVMDALGGYPEKKRDYPSRTLEALKLAIADYRQRVAKGEVPDYAQMQAARQMPSSPAASAPATDGDGKILIKLR